jgi:hypothetical protein
MILRSFWDEDPCFLDTYTYPASLREQLGQVFSESSLGPNKRHVCKLTRTYSDRSRSCWFSGCRSVGKWMIMDNLVRGTEIVEDLKQRWRGQMIFCC